jgi:hypothetical protein
MKTAFGFCIFCALLFSTTGCTSTRSAISPGENEQGWRIVKADKSDEPSWIISTRKIVGTNFLEYKIEGDIESSPQACVASFRQDIQNHADDLHNRKYPIYEISEATEESLLTYLVHNEPFPLKNTEMSVRYTFFSNEDGSSGVSWKEAWDDCPVQPSKKLSRVQSFRGSLHILPVSNDTSKVVKSVQFDPKKMPLWLVEPMVYKFLKGGLRDLREMTARTITQ